MWRHYRKFFRDMSEVTVYEVQSPTIPMAFFSCQFRMTQAIFRNALQKNALKNFILNIHELKISIQARKNAQKIQFFSLMILLFWLPFYVTTLKRGLWKDGSSPSSRPSHRLSLVASMKHLPPWQTWITVWLLRALCCALFLRSTYSLWGGSPHASL